MSRPARLLLVSSETDVHQGLYCPPSGLYKLLAYASARGIPVDILDNDLSEAEPFLERARAGEYDIVGISVAHWTAVADAERIWTFRRALAQSGRPFMILGGGPGGTLDRELWLRMGVDLILPGLAERRLTALCLQLHEVPLTEAGKFDIPAIAARLDGAIYLADGRVVVRHAPALDAEEFHALCFTELMENDRIPFPAYWDLLRRHHANATPQSSAGFIIEAVRLFTTSHCSQHCGFCCSPSFIRESTSGKQTMQMLSADECIALTRKYVRDYGARCVMISDDDFPIGNATGLRRLREFCEKIIALKETGELPAPLRFGAQTRVRDVLTIHPDGRREPNHEILRLMGRAGFTGVSMGVETFSDRMMRMPSVNKIGVTSADCLAVILAMQDAGVVPQVNLILGIPEYEPEELLDTLRIAYGLMRKNCDVVVNGKIQANPGTHLADSDSYTKTYVNWIHPETGECFPIVEYVIPQHPLVATAIAGFDELSATIRDQVLRKFGKLGQFVHRRVTALCGFTGVCRLLGDRELEAQFMAFLEETVADPAP